MWLERKAARTATFFGGSLKEHTHTLDFETAQEQAFQLVNANRNQHRKRGKSCCAPTQGFPVTCIVGNWASATDLAELGPVTCFLGNQRRVANWFLFES